MDSLFSIVNEEFESSKSLLLKTNLKTKRFDLPKIGRKIKKKAHQASKLYPYKESCLAERNTFRNNISVLVAEEKKSWLT